MFAMVLSLTALIFVGAGCGSDKIAIPAEARIGESALSNTEVDLRGGIAGLQDMQEGSSDEADPADEVMEWEIPTSFPGVLPDGEIQGKQIRISTAKGDIVFELYPDEAPKAVSNMVALARSGYYDGLTFHRVVPGFVIQGGDPKGNGTGGPGYAFGDEPVSLDYDAGIVAMANSGPNTNGSQYFIVLEDQLGLPKLYTIFGRVTGGMEVVRKIAVGDVMTDVEVEDKR